MNVVNLEPSFPEPRGPEPTLHEHLMHHLREFLEDWTSFKTTAMAKASAALASEPPKELKETLWAYTALAGGDASPRDVNEAGNAVVSALQQMCNARNATYPKNAVREMCHRIQNDDGNNLSVITDLIAELEVSGDEVAIAQATKLRRHVHVGEDQRLANAANIIGNLERFLVDLQVCTAAQPRPLSPPFSNDLG